MPAEAHQDHRAGQRQQDQSRRLGHQHLVAAIGLLLTEAGVRGRFGDTLDQSGIDEGLQLLGVIDIQVVDVRLGEFRRPARAQQAGQAAGGGSRSAALVAEQACKPAGRCCRSGRSGRW